LLRCPAGAVAGRRATTTAISTIRGASDGDGASGADVRAEKYWHEEWCTMRRSLSCERGCGTSSHFFTMLKLGFNGAGLVVSYLRNVSTTKEAAMKLTVIASRPAFAIDRDEWISYSHWGMFPVRRKSSNSSSEA
jgi:hypothetical protein